MYEFQSCVNYLFSTNSCSGNLSSKNLFYTLKVATTESSFIFDIKFYKQINGVGMDLPLGSTLANTFLCHYSQTVCCVNFSQNHV